MKLAGSSKNVKIIVDIMMTIFLVLSFVRWSGDSGFIFHAIVGTACTLFFTLHVCIHLKWIKAVTKSVFEGKLNKTLKWKYIVDVLLLVIWGTAIVTGFLAIGYFAADIDAMAVFSRLHALTSRIGLGLTLIHVFQHLPQIKSYIGIKNSPKASK